MTTFEAQPQPARSTGNSGTEVGDTATATVTSAGTGYPTPAWRKAYREGSRPDLRVPYREVQLTNGRTVPLYDTSGPYTDQAYEPDVRRGLPALRDAWIRQRGDVEEYDGREARPEDDGIKHTSPRGGNLRNLDAVFPGRPRRPLRGRGGAAVTQLAYAKRGVVTPRWSSWRCARASPPSTCGPRWPAAGPSSRST